MTLVHPGAWLKAAQRGGYAIGAFNANTMEQIQAVALAAQAEGAPAMIQISNRALEYAGGGDPLLGLEYLGALGKLAAAAVEVPIALHLDHGAPETAARACALGFTSIMFDGSDLPAHENLAVTQRLCALAHDHGVWFEAELGYVPKPGSARLDELTAELTDPADVAAFVTAGGVDALAIAIGSHHGQLRQETLLDLPRLAAIRAALRPVGDPPLVLHGSSGVADDSLQAGIAAGLCKINLATQLNQAFTAAVRRRLDAEPALADPRPYLGDGCAAMIERVRERLRFLGSARRAAA